ncbi:rhamnulose-1-phosphate aldolase [Clostridia bacterium]|nr:rhamnulose-1-phosphate aldolase [Clostridia bacterium]
MSNIQDLSHIQDLLRGAEVMSHYGWSERNGGNISILLVADKFEFSQTIRHFPLEIDAPKLRGRLLLVTGTGKYFRNLSRNPEENLGILRIMDSELELVWGFQNGGVPTSELSSHLRSHAERLRVDPTHSVVMHTHPTNLIALTAVHSLDEREFTRSLWRMCSECLMFIPDGIGVLPWMPCGDDRIGAATAEKMRNCRLVIWANHGAFATGSSMDDALGLIEIADKAADIYLKIAHLPQKQTITDAQLRQLAEVCQTMVREGYLYA